MNPDSTDALRGIPSVDQLLHTNEIQALLSTEPRAAVLRILRDHLEGLRERLRRGESVAYSREDIVREVAALVRGRPRGPRRVLNATGVVLHTNLGRARLAREAIDSLVEAARGACDLEFDLESGKRSSRTRHLDRKIAAVTGAEDAFVVNNNAGALVLCVNELAQGLEVIVSRGELVEIGGSFRLPDVLSRAGAILVEVGTTNRTRIEDYARAIGPKTAALLRVHRSNFRQEGFVEEPSLHDLTALGKERGIPVIHDLGSGSLHELEATRKEPGLRESLDAGAELVTFSGDKLLGGPQAGIIVGASLWVGRLRKNPLARALRVDKFTIAALAATLDLLEDPDRARTAVPTLRALSWTRRDLAPRATQIAKAIGVCSSLRVRVLTAQSEVGGGAAPAEELATTVVALAHESLSAEELARELRRAAVPIVGRIVQDELVLDPRTLDPEEDEECARAIIDRFGPAKGD
jgi:L-seryl-tRNA(Ser) seleniumtransferase